MGSEGDSRKIEDTVGTIVWVRRRNGSWWPGRIMGLHELPESCLVSPRSGTPVKLLGREDASVDWYNLEKSRRVKPFRCGEYDECIEKAKASAASANKKAVKYARREDAILHALELEGSRDSDDDQVLQSKTGNSNLDGQCMSIGTTKSMSSSDSEDDDMDGREGMFEANLTKELSQSGLTFEDPSHVSTSQAHYLQKTRRKTPNDSGDDGSEGTKRMRGLEDLGMGVLSKRKASVCSDSEGSDELVQQDSSSFSEPNVCSSLSNGSPVNRSTDSCSYVRRNQAQVPPAHENFKRKNRCLPLTKVLESTTMVSVPVFCDQGGSPGRSSHQGAADSKLSALESTDSKKTSVSVVINNNSNCTEVSCDKDASLEASVYPCDAGVEAGHILSDPKGSDIPTILEFPENNGSDGLFDVPFVGEEKHTPDASSKFQLGASGRHSNSCTMAEPNNCSLVEPISLRNEGLDESGSTSLTVDVNSVGPMVAKPTSKWQSKRKRNSRPQSRRPNKRMVPRRSVDRDSESEVSLTGKNHTDGLFQGFDRKVDISTFDESLALDNSLHWSNQVSEPSYLDAMKYGRRNLSNREGVDHTTDKKLNIPRENCVVGKLPMQVRNKELYLKDESVSPLVPHRSLPYRQSRFTPHSKYQDAYVPSRNVFDSSSLYDVHLEVQASYRGRHVPLVSLMSKLNGKAIVGHPVTVEACADGYTNVLLNNMDYLASSSGELYEVPENMSDQSADAAAISLFQGRYAKPSESLQVDTVYGQSPMNHLSMKSSASPKKSPKAKKSGILSKKTRKLSSFVAPDQRERDRKPVVEKLGGPVITCVPLNIVFSRINEALNGSARSAHRKLTLGNV